MHILYLTYSISVHVEFVFCILKGRPVLLAFGEHTSGDISSALSQQAGIMSLIPALPHSTGGFSNHSEWTVKVMCRKKMCTKRRSKRV